MGPVRQLHGQRRRRARAALDKDGNIFFATDFGGGTMTTTDGEDPFVVKLSGVDGSAPGPRSSQPIRPRPRGRSRRGAPGSTRARSCSGATKLLYGFGKFIGDGSFFGKTVTNAGSNDAYLFGAVVL